MDMKKMKEHGAIRHDTKYGYIEADYYEPVQVMYDPSVPLFYIYRESDTEKVEVSDMKLRFPDVAKRFLAEAKAQSNPSKAERAAIGGGAGALLLGPLGAVAGGYLGAKTGKKKKSKRKKKNPTRSAALRKMMRG
jgi:hypothetical protein